MNTPYRGKSPGQRHDRVITGRAPRVILPIKMDPALRHRLKVAAAEEGTTYAGLFTKLLDLREDRLKRQRAAQVHPLHRPAEPKSAYPGAGHHGGAGGGGGSHAAFAPREGAGGGGVAL